MRHSAAMRLYYILVFLICVVGCTPAARLARVQMPAESYPVNPTLIPAVNAFGLDLFRKIAAGRPGANAFVSPLSIALALAMTYNGAAGETQQAMAGVLHIGGVTLQEVNEANAGLYRSLLDRGSGVTLRIANSLWARQGVDFKQDFLDRNRRYYGAEVATLDFTTPAAARRINRWVSDSTGGKITNIVPDQIDPNAVLFLINAIYYEAQWQKAFIKAETHDAPFHLAGGGEVQVPLMSQNGVYPYYQSQGFQAVQLPYKNGRMRMLIFLPDPDSSLDGFLASLNAANWEHWMAGFEEQAGQVALPRFKTEEELVLNDALKGLGMDVAFDKERADFGAMRPIPPNLYIGEVRHKTYIEVNEVGTVAAAATSVEILVEGARLGKFALVADRPFFYAIQDGETGAVLFMGTLWRP